MVKKKLAKQCMAAFLSFTMMFSVFPTSAVNAAGEGETTVQKVCAGWQEW